MIGDITRELFVVEPADLDGPLSAALKGLGCLKQLNAHFARPFANHVQLLGGGAGEIDDAAFDEWAAVGDADDCSVAVAQARDSDDGAKRQGTVRGGHSVHVIDLTV